MARRQTNTREVTITLLAEFAKLDGGVARLMMIAAESFTLARTEPCAKAIPTAMLVIDHSVDLGSSKCRSKAPLPLRALFRQWRLPRGSYANDPSRARQARDVLNKWSASHGSRYSESI
jgi:hypothetical protein